jgi:predicted aldo/keto reductase-like oxidoreductase
MLQYAYDHGVNYFDTAWPYHNSESEPLLGEFLASIARRKFTSPLNCPAGWSRKRAIPQISETAVGKAQDRLHRLLSSARAQSTQLAAMKKLRSSILSFRPKKMD